MCLLLAGRREAAKSAANSHLRAPLNPPTEKNIKLLRIFRYTRKRGHVCLFSVYRLLIHSFVIYVLFSSILISEPFNCFFVCFFVEFLLIVVYRGVGCA